MDDLVFLEAQELAHLLRTAAKGIDTHEISEQGRHTLAKSLMLTATAIEALIGCK